ncbi:MAG: SDR family oxidoreductase, partial [Dehalococcoidales bacterium]|nr:SDR family oxidoreductase [Dehalococcoidales bacterium]
MDLKLKDKVALVTGAGNQIGYGKTIALTLAGEGCDIIAADIDIDGANKTSATVREMGRQSLAVKADVTVRSEVDAMVKAALEKFGRIDILVNNAGASSNLQHFINMTRSDWDIDICVNLYGQMNVAQAVLPSMISRHYGRIVNISGGQGSPTIAVYGAAKAGIEAWSRALAREVGPLGIFINGVQPGMAETGLTTKAPPEFLERYKQSSPLKRMCTPDDLAPAVAYLASDMCSYMMGQFLRVDTHGQSPWHFTGQASLDLNPVSLATLHT